MCFPLFFLSFEFLSSRHRTLSCWAVGVSCQGVRLGSCAPIRSENVNACEAYLPFLYIRSDLESLIAVVLLLGEVASARQTEDNGRSLELCHFRRAGPHRERRVR